MKLLDAVHELTKAPTTGPPWALMGRRTSGQIVRVLLDRTEVHAMNPTGRTTSGQIVRVQLDLADVNAMNPM
jgi:hypothetical protein